MLIDSEAKASFSSRATNSMLKIVCRYNHHGVRNILINKVEVKDECLRYIKRESWKHVILCIKNEEL